MVDLRSKETDQLFKAMMKFESIDEYYAFFEDLCTVKEIKDMSQRFNVAILLNEGKSYVEVSKEGNASNATISRIKKCLDFGAGGYKNAISKIEEE